MKRIIALIFFILSIFFFSTQIVNAASKTYTFEATNTITSVLSKNSKADTYTVFKKKKGIIKATKQVEKIYQKNGKPKYWKANLVKSGGKTWWQIADNRYLNAKSIVIINEKMTNMSKIKYSNYTPDLPKYNGKDIVLITGDPKSDSQTIGLYKKEKGKLVYINRRVNVAKGNSLQYWKADKVIVNGKVCWKVGKNLYFKPSRIMKVDTKIMEKAHEELTNLGNYPDSGRKKSNRDDTILVNNTDGNQVPIMVLQSDEKSFTTSSRTVLNNSTWKFDKIMKIDNITYCRVATNEWIDATHFVVKPDY